MKLKLLKIISASLALTIFLTLSGCKGESKDTSSNGTVPTIEMQPVKIALTYGNDSVSIVRLMSQNLSGKTEGSYSVSLYTSANKVSAALANNAVDIGFVPITTAIQLNETASHIRIMGVNRASNLFLASSESVDSLEQLKGKKVFVSDSEKSDIFYLIKSALERAGLTDKDITFKYYSSPDELSENVNNGECDAVIAGIPTVSQLISENSEWNVISDISEILKTEAGAVSYAIVANNESSLSNPAGFETFIKELDSSAEYIKENPEKAATLLMDNGICRTEEIAKETVEKFNADMVYGGEMKSFVKDYLSSLPDIQISNSTYDSLFYYS